MGNLIKNIEALRKKLHLLLDSNDLTDVNVVKCSQELDELLVKYERFKLLLKKNRNIQH